MTERLSLRAKSDHRSAELGLTASAHELNVAYELNDNWGVATGVRVDERRDDSAVVPLTQEQGERTDAVVQVGYDSKRRWSTYGFVQDTVSVDGDREENARIGTGGVVPTRRAPQDRRRGLERRSRRRRQDRHELSAQRPHDAVLELRARERAHRQRLARDARQRRQHRRRRQDAAVGQHERVSRGALSEQRVPVGPHALDGHQLGADGAAEPRREHRHRHAARRADGRRDRAPRGRLPHRLRVHARCSSRAASSTAPTRPSSRISRSTRARPGSCATTSSGSSPRRRACSASSITPRA